MLFLGPGGLSRGSLRRRLIEGCSARIDRRGEKSGHWQATPAPWMWEQPAKELRGQPIKSFPVVPAR